MGTRRRNLARTRWAEAQRRAENPPHTNPGGASSNFVGRKAHRDSAEALTQLTLDAETAAPDFGAELMNELLC